MAKLRINETLNQYVWNYVSVIHKDWGPLGFIGVLIQLHKTLCHESKSLWIGIVSWRQLMDLTIPKVGGGKNAKEMAIKLEDKNTKAKKHLEKT